MKRIVGFNIYQGAGLVVGGLLLVWILEAETVISNLVMFGLIVVLAWRELARRRAKTQHRVHRSVRGRRF
jgi:hypothetical protein